MCNKPKHLFVIKVFKQLWAFTRGDQEKSDQRFERMEEQGGPEQEAGNATPQDSQAELREQEDEEVGGEIHMVP